MRSLTLSLIAVLLAAAPAQSGWQEPQTVLSGVPAGSAFTADGGAHTAASAWISGARTAALVIRDVGADGTLGTRREVVPSSLTDRFYGGSDALFAADGSGVVLSRRVHAPYQRVRAAFFAPDGSVTPWRTISSPGHTARLLFDNLAVAPDGRALATWLQYEGKGGGWHLEGAFREPGAAVFGAPVRISSTLASRNVVITTDLGPRGDALVTWRTNGRDGDSFAALARPGQSFGTPQRLGPTGFGSHAVIGADGRIVLAESVLPTSRSSRFALRVWQLAADATGFGTPQVVADTCDCGEAENFELALSPAGRVAIVWGDATSSGTGPDGPGPVDRFVLEVYEGDFGAGLRRTARLSAGSVTHSGAGIAIDAAGDLLVAWGEGVLGADGQGSGSRYLAAVKPAGGAFGAPREVAAAPRSGDSFGSVALDLSAPDRATALIGAYLDSGWRLQVSRLVP